MHLVSALIFVLRLHQLEPRRHRKTRIIHSPREAAHLRIRLHQYARRRLCRRSSRISRWRIGLLLPKSTQAESAQLTAKRCRSGLFRHIPSARHRRPCRRRRQRSLRRGRQRRTIRRRPHPHHLQNRRPLQFGHLLRHLRHPLARALVLGQHGRIDRAVEHSSHLHRKLPVKLLHLVITRNLRRQPHIVRNRQRSRLSRALVRRIHIHRKNRFFRTQPGHLFSLFRIPHVNLKLDVRRRRLLRTRRLTLLLLLFHLRRSGRDLLLHLL